MSKKIEEFIILNKNEDFIYIMSVGKTRNIILPYELDDHTLRFFFHVGVTNEHRVQILRKLVPLAMNIIDRDIYIELLHDLHLELEDNNKPKNGIMNLAINFNDPDPTVSIYSFHERCRFEEVARNFLSDEEIEYLDGFKTDNLKIFPVLFKNGSFVLFVGKKDYIRLYFTNYESLIGDISSIMVVKLIKYILPYWRNIFKILYVKDKFIVSLDDRLAELVPNNNHIKVLEYNYKDVKLYT